MIKEDWPSMAAIYDDGISARQATFEMTTPSWEEWNDTHLDAAGIDVTGEYCQLPVAGALWFPRDRAEGADSETGRRVAGYGADGKKEQAIYRLKCKTGITNAESSDPLPFRLEYKSWVVVPAFYTEVIQHSEPIPVSFIHTLP
jgi:hypothetical protein